jgi:type IV secretory pathway VirB2 component (pilin)
MRHRIVDKPTGYSLSIIIAVIIVVAYGIAWCIDLIQYGPFF